MRFRSHGRGGRHLTLTPNITSPPPPRITFYQKSRCSWLYLFCTVVFFVVVNFFFFNLNFCEISGGSFSSLLVMFVISLGLGLAF